MIQELHSGPSTLPREIRAVKVADDVKVTLQLPDQLDDGQKQAHLLQIERVLNSKIDDRINVFLEEMKDSNSIRRL